MLVTVKLRSEPMKICVFKYLTYDKEVLLHLYRAITKSVHFWSWTEWVNVLCVMFIFNIICVNINSEMLTCITWVGLPGPTTVVIRHWLLTLPEITLWSPSNQRSNDYEKGNWLNECCLYKWRTWSLENRSCTDSRDSLSYDVIVWFVWYGIWWMCI